MSKTETKDPYAAYNFRLIIADGTEARFLRCSGLEVVVNTIAYRESGRNQVVRKLPGRVEYSPVVLQYGLTNSTSLWDWFLTVVNGRVERKNVTIQLLDPAGEKVLMVWDLINAWPSQWKGTDFDAMSNQLAVESLVLTFETMERKRGEAGA